MSETPESQEWRPQETDPLRRLTAEVRDLRRALRSLTNGILSNAGLKVEPDTLRVLQTLTSEDGTWELDGAGNARFDGNTAIGGDTAIGGRTTISGDTSVTGDLDVSGNLDVTGPASFGSTLGVAGTATVTGQLRSSNYSAGTSGWRLTSSGLEVNDITLRGGIIGNDALTSPLTFRSGFDRGEGFSLSGGWTELADTTITVPAGFTQMLMYSTGTVMARNDQAGIEYLDARISYQVNGSGPIRATVTTGVDVRPGRSAVAVVPGIWSTAVTPGDAWRFWIEGWTAVPWSADSVNHAAVEVACLFTR